MRSHSGGHHSSAVETIALLAIAAAAAGVFSVVVPNIATLTALPGASDGVTAYVQSVESPWDYVANGAQFTIDGITVAATTAGGNTRWVRDDQYSSPIWRIGRDFWYIDTVAGNDENTGLTPLTALKTGAEHARRWGHQNLIQQSGTSVNFSVNIFILNDIIAPDYFQVDVILEGGTELWIQGTPTTIVASPLGATAITNENQATNTPWDFTDAVTSASLAVGQRIRWTAGVAVDACAWIAKSLGANKWRMSSPLLSTATFGVVPTAKTPAAHDAYVIERLTQLNIGIVSVTELANSVGFGAFAQFNDLDIAGIPGDLTLLNNGPLDLNNEIVIFNQCRFSTAMECYAVYYANCGMADNQIFRGTSNVYGGLAYGGSGKFIEWQSNNEGQMLLDVYIQGIGGLLVAGNVVIGNIGVFDCAPNLLTGDGLCIGSPLAPSNSSTGLVAIFGLIWGSGNAGFGMRIHPNSNVSYSVVPKVTGVAGDLIMGAGGKSRFFDETLGVYSAVIATTWANIAAAQPAGFGGNAHNLSDNVHFVPYS